MALKHLDRAAWLRPARRRADDRRTAGRNRRVSGSRGNGVLPRAGRVRAYPDAAAGVGAAVSAGLAIATGCVRPAAGRRSRGATSRPPRRRQNTPPSTRSEGVPATVGFFIVTIGTGPACPA